MQNEIYLYHGTNVKFDQVDLSFSKDKRDFGKGFYTTTFREQAEGWAENMYIRYGGEGRFVMEFKLQLAEELSIMKYPGLTGEWLSMIKDNRLYGGIQHTFDIVIGPVADDNIMRTIALYVAGIYNQETALEQLRPFQAHDQISLHTQKALKYLIYLGRKELKPVKAQSMEESMKTLYCYRDQDITLDILMKVEHVVRLIVAETGKSFDDCLYEFYRSKAYETLQKTGSLMWAESAEFVADEFFREYAEDSDKEKEVL